jgi:hypothetical protein
MLAVVVEVVMQVVSVSMVSTPLTRRGRLPVPNGINSVMLAVHMLIVNVNDCMAVAEVVPEVAVVMVMVDAKRLINEIVVQQDGDTSTVTSRGGKSGAGFGLGAHGQHTTAQT